MIDRDLQDAADHAVLWWSAYVPPMWIRRLVSLVDAVLILSTIPDTMGLILTLSILVVHVALERDRTRAERMRASPLVGVTRTTLVVIGVISLVQLMSIDPSTLIRVAFDTTWSYVVLTRDPPPTWAAGLHRVAGGLVVGSSSATGYVMVNSSHLGSGTVGFGLSIPRLPRSSRGRGATLTGTIRS